ncbi:hypothetical protein L7F22_047444 [Adiantum nelumboides]|nr:hypothetical protein [Adiantum nelumboides]
MHARDPNCSAKASQLRDSRTDGRRLISSTELSGAPTQHGIWASLTPAHHLHPPASSQYMSRVRSCHCFCESSSSHGSSELPLPQSPAASSPIQIAAPASHQYQQYRLRFCGAEGMAAELRLYNDNMRDGSQSAPMEALQPQWRGYRKQRTLKKHTQVEEEEEVEVKVEVEEEGEEEAVEKDDDIEAAMVMGGSNGREGQEEEWLPPHELVAREWAAASSCGGAAFSLCHGVGRTLKGRDLCRVRNAILKQTGFI